LSRNSPSARTTATLKGVVVGIALLEAASLQARPSLPDGVRLNADNIAQPSGDAYQTGRALLAVNDVTGAMAAFRQALVDDPKSVDALNSLGVCYDRLGRFDISRGYYDSALALAPGSALVLNNLGYSLYLQGAYDAAIPVLQRAAAAADSAVAASSRRVLTMVAARMRDTAVQASAAAALAEVQAPRARVEMAANGEQRLVINAPAPDRALVAALGDEAVLVTIAKPWTAREQRALERDAQAQDRADASAAAETASAAERAAGAAAITAAANAVDIHAAATDHGTGTVVTAAIDHAAAATSMAMVPTRRSAVDDAMRARRARNVAPVARVQSAALHVPGLSRLDDETPAWLMTSRRADRVTPAQETSWQAASRSHAVVAFDSDDAELNAFAARMRGLGTARIRPA
jgi:Tfp pilus assembly protein PilF